MSAIPCARSWGLLLMVACVNRDHKPREGTAAPPAASTAASASATAPATPAPAPEGTWVIRRGADVAKIVAPIMIGGSIAAGYRLAGVDAARDRIVIRATKGKREVRLTLIHADSPEDAQARSRSFKMQLAGDPAAPKESTDVGVKLIEIVTNDDDGSLWVREGEAAAPR